MKKEEEEKGKGEKRDVRNTLGTSRYESEVKTFLVLFFGLISLAYDL
jgi:nitrate reductase NapE component